MVVDNRRSPMEECNEDPFWEDLYEKFCGLETVMDLPYNAADIEAVIKYVLEEGRKRGVAQEKDAQAAAAEYAAWLRHKELGEESPSEEHVRQQEWRDKHYEKWMDDKPGEDE